MTAFRPYPVAMDDASMIGLMGRVTGTVGPGLVWGDHVPKDLKG